jgi:hypothetical protein
VRKPLAFSGRSRPMGVMMPAPVMTTVCGEVEAGGG